MKQFEFTKKDMLNMNLSLIKNLVYEADAYPNEERKLKNLIMAQRLISAILSSYGIGGTEPKSKK